MTRSSTAHKTATNRFLAVLTIALMLVGAMPLAQAAPESVTLDAATYHGDGAIVTFSFTDGAAEGESQTVAVTGGLTGTVTAYRTTGDTFVGQFKIGTGPQGDHVDLQSLNPGSGAEVTFKVGDSSQATWKQTHDLTIVSPDADDERMLTVGDPVTLGVEDDDLEATSSCPVVEQRINGGAWTSITPTSCTTDAGEAEIRITVTSADITELDTITFRVLDPHDGFGNKAQQQVTYEVRVHEDTPRIEVLELDYRTSLCATTPVAGCTDRPLTGLNTQYVLRVTDDSLNEDPSIADTIVVDALSTKISPKPLELTETGPDTGEFQRVFEVGTSEGIDTIPVAGDDTEIEFAIEGGRTTATTWTWERDAPARIILTDQNGRSTTGSPALVSVFGNSDTTDRDQGAFVRVTVDDPDDATPSHVIVRHNDLSKEECSEDGGTAPLVEATDPRCERLELTSGVGYILFVAPGTDVATLQTNEIVLPITNANAFTVEYLDSGAKGPRIIGGTDTSLVWFAAYSGSVRFDQDNYRVGDTATITLNDPDPGRPASRDVTVEARDGTDDGLVTSQTITLSQTSTPGEYTGTITIAPSGLDARDGDRLDVRYEDPKNGLGAEETVRVTGLRPQVVEGKTGFLAWDESLVTGQDPNRLVLVDNNVEIPPTATVETPLWSGDSLVLSLAGSEYIADVSSESSVVVDEYDAVLDSGACVYEIDLGVKPIEPGLTAPSKWTLTVDDVSAMDADDDIIHVDLLTGILTIPAGENNNVVNPGCNTRNDVTGLEIGFTPAAKVQERFIANGTTTTFPLGRYTGLVGPGLPSAPHAPVLAGGLPAALGDTTPTDASGATTDSPTAGAAWTRVFGTCANGLVTVRVDGESVACNTVTLDKFAANVTLDPAPPSNALVEIAYFANARIVEESPASGLGHLPVVAASLTNLTTGETLAESAGPAFDYDALVANGQLGGFDCPCTYRTDVYQNNRVQYGSSLPLEQSVARTVTATYHDDNAERSLTRQVDAAFGYVSRVSSELTVSSPQGQQTYLVFGSDAKATIVVKDSGANTDPATLDTLTVTVDANPVTQQGRSGTDLGQETITLVETTPSSGEFTGTLRFETQRSAGNGRIFVDVHDTVIMDIEYADAGLSQPLWYHKVAPATLTASADEVRGDRSTVKLTVTDSDANNRHVAWTDTADDDAKVSLGAFLPIVGESVIVHRCSDGTPASCSPLKRVTTAGALQPGEFRLTASTGAIELHSGAAGDLVRVDFRTSGRDDVDVTATLVDRLGLVKSTTTVTDLAETSSTSNRYEKTIELATLFSGIEDGETVRFSYDDANYHEVGADAASCAPFMADCAYRFSRAAARADALRAEVQWFEADAGTISTLPDTLHGRQRVRVTIDDGDANVDPAKQDKVSVDVRHIGGSTVSLDLVETAADSGRFIRTVTPATLLGLGTSDGGATVEVRYRDAYGPTGSPLTIREDATWEPSSLATFEILKQFVNDEGTVPVRVVDLDANTQSDERETISSWSCPSGVTCTGVLEETDFDSGSFEGDLTVDGTPGTPIQVGFQDPADHLGRGATVYADVTVVESGVGIPSLDAAAYDDPERVVEVMVPGGAGEVEIHVGSVGEPVARRTLDTDGEARFTLGDDADNVTVPLDSAFFVVYRDATTTPRVLYDRAVFIPFDSAVESAAEVVSGTEGKNGWFTTAPTVSITATKNADRLDAFEYRFGEGEAYTTCAEPCSLTVDEEGAHTLLYRAVFRGGAEEENTLEVNFDATAPAVSVQNLTATSVKDGGIRLDWVSPVDLQDPLQFGAFLVYRGDTDTLVGNATEASFTDTPDADGTYAYYVVVEDMAGNKDKSRAVNVSGLSDRVAPKLSAAGVVQEVLLEEEDQLDADLWAVLDGTPPTDFDKVVAVVTPPAGGQESTVTLTDSGSGNYTGVFSGFNVTGTWSFSFRALDKAGNFEPITDSVRFQGIDQTAPTVSVPEVVERGSPLKVRLQDNDAGLATAEYAIDDGSFTDVDLPSATSLDYTFDVPTAALSIGEHTITVRATDLASPANTVEQEFTFDVVAPGTLPGDDTGGEPSIALVEDLVASGTPLKVRVTADTLTALTVAVDGAGATNVLGDWSAATRIVNVATSGLSAGEHTATIVATNAAGTATQEVSFYLLEPGVPTPPASLTVTIDEDGFPSLSWTPSTSSDVGGYLVHRSSSPWKVVAVLGPDTTTYTDKNVDKDKVYKYKVTAFGTDGEGELAEGADSESSLAFFSRVQGTGDVSVSEPRGFFAQYWWVFLVLLAVVGAVVAVYVYRDRLFATKDEEDEEYGAYPDEVEEDPFGASTHELRCPNCTHEFSVTGEKPVVTTCPNCGKKGILR